MADNATPIAESHPTREQVKTEDGANVRRLREQEAARGIADRRQCAIALRQRREVLSICAQDKRPILR